MRTKRHTGSGKYEVTIATAQEEHTFYSNDQNYLSKIRSSAYMDGLAVSVILPNRNASKT